MKQIFSSPIKSMGLLLLLMVVGSQIYAQEGNFTVQIKQPVGDTIYVCPGKNIIFFAEGVNEDGSAFDPNQVTFSWDFGYEGQSQDGNTVSYKYPVGGHYILRLYTTNTEGAGAQNVPTVHVFVAIPPVFMGTRSDNFSICSGDPITLTGFVNPVPWDEGEFSFVNTHSATDFVWSGSNIVSDRHGVARTVPPLDEGHMDYVFRIQDNYGCFHDTSLTVYGVYAEYSVDPLLGEAPLDVIFSVDSSSNGGDESNISYRWESYERSSDTSNLLVSETETFTIERPGEYISRMISKYNQCTYRYDYDEFIQVDSSLLEIPNIFTPNEDGANDYFQVKAVSLRSLQGQIYNRWGKLVYEWDDWKTAEAGWNGKNMGTGANSPSGTYFYVIKARGWDWDYSLDGFKQYQDKVYTGSVTLLR